jgi:hypothetical protein
MKRNAIRLAQEVLRDRRKRADGGTDEWQSTGRLINEDDSINWGNPEVVSDFFRADKEDLRRRREAERDVGGGDAPPSAPKVSEGRQMAEPRVSPPKQEVADGDAPPEPDTFRMPAQNVPVMAGATPPLSSDLDRGPLPPAMQAVANRYSPPEYKEALTDEQRQALALEQWKAAGRSGTPDNPNPAPPPASAPAPIVQASLTTATPQQTATDANRQPLRFAPTEGAEKPAPAAAPTSAILAAIRSNESRNKPTAQNPRSSAGGLYQFLDSTWGNVLRRMDPQQYGGYSDRQLRSLKTDPRYVDLQHAAADFMLNKDIAPRLEKAGIPLTPGSAYLSWFQGPAGAIKTYTAPDNATVSQVFPRTVAANSNMRFNGKSYANWTMSDLRQWADTKMAQRMQPARQPLRFGPVEGYEEGGRVGYANEGAVRDPDDPRQWLEFGGQEMDRAPAGLPIGQAVGTSTAGHIGAQLADATELAHQAATNQLPPDYFHTDEGIERAFNAASAPMLGSFALAPVVGPTVKSGETALSMFVPVLRDDPALALAKEMLAKGKSKDEIWREVGMRPGPESHFGSYELESPVPDKYGRYQRVGEMPENPEPRWFKEISDENLKLSRKPEEDQLIWPGSGINMKNEAYSVEHPELKAQFPEFEQLNRSVNVNPVHMNQGAYSSSGEYSPGKFGKSLQVFAENPEQARSISAHELQHFVADVGGLEQGNNPSNPDIINFFHSIRNEAKQTYESIASEFSKFVDDSYKQALKEFNIRPDAPQAMELHNKVAEEARKIYYETEPEKMQALDRSRYIISRITDPYDLYQHMYGEALARSTQERLHMTPEQRRATPPKFNYHNDGDTLIPYTPIPENQLYSEKDLMDFKFKSSGGRTGECEECSEKNLTDRAMNLSKFGTDAVQTAVNLARQHRGRPENPRSTS